MSCFCCRCRSILECWCRCRFRCRFSTPIKYIPLLMFIIACRSSVFCCPVKFKDVRKNNFNFFSFSPGREKISSALVPFIHAHIFFSRALSCFPFFEGKQFVLKSAIFLYSREVLKKKCIVNSSTLWQLSIFYAL